MSWLLFSQTPIFREVLRFLRVNAAALVAFLDMFGLARFSLSV